MQGKEGEQAADYREREGKMHPRKGKGQEEYGEQLGIDAAAYLILCHADLLHYLESRLILIALGYLLVVDDEDRRKGEHKAEQDTDVEKSAV